MLGRAATVKVNKDVRLSWTVPAILMILSKNRADQNQIEETTSDFDREASEGAKLSGGVAVIQVGAATETELKEKKLKLRTLLTQQGRLLKKESLPAAELLS